MNGMQKYFSDGMNRSNERFNNADWEFADDWNFADDRFGYADEANAPSTDEAVKSQPYILNIQNTTTTDVSTVNLLNAFVNIGASNNGISTSLSVSMGVTTVSYLAFLYQTMNKPFHVAMMYVQSTTNAQVLETITITMNDATGNQLVRPLVPVVDPYQLQTGMVVYKYPFRIDGYTQLTLSKVYASLTVKIYLYPDKVVDVGRGASGYSAMKEFGNPKVIAQGR
jgi:hypothetical protein